LSSRSTVAIPQKLCCEMLEHARTQLPLEACGIISGSQQGKPLKFFPTRNELESTTRYNVHPEDLLRIFNYLEKNEEILWGIFHSHPENEAYPTETDIKLAYYPQAYYLIASFKRPGYPVLRGFIIKEGKVEEVDLREY